MNERVANHFIYICIYIYIWRYFKPHSNLFNSADKSICRLCWDQSVHILDILTSIFWDKPRSCVSTAPSTFIQPRSMLLFLFPKIKIHLKVKI